MLLLNNKTILEMNFEDSLLSELEIVNKKFLDSEEHIEEYKLNTFLGWKQEVEKVRFENRIDKIGIFDFETTHMNGRAVSLAIIVYSLSEKRVLSEHYWEFKNPIPMDPESVEIHGLTEEYLSDKEDFLVVYKREIFEVLKDLDCLIAHNASYDVNVIGRELYSYGISPKFNLRIIDSAPMLKRQMETKKYNLEFCSDFFNIDVKDLNEGLNTSYHNALYDCRVLLEVIKAAMEKESESGI